MNAENDNVLDPSLDRAVELRVDQLFNRDAEKHRIFLEAMFKRVLWALGIIIIVSCSIGAWIFGKHMESAMDTIIEENDIKNTINEEVSKRLKSEKATNFIIEGVQKEVNKLLPTILSGNKIQQQLTVSIVKNLQSENVKNILNESLDATIRKALDSDIDERIKNLLEEKISQQEKIEYADIIDRHINKSIKNKFKGEKGDQGKAGPQGPEGAPGKDADPELVANIIFQKNKEFITKILLENKDVMAEKNRWNDVTGSIKKFSLKCDYKWITVLDNTSAVFYASVVKIDKLSTVWEDGKESWLRANKRGVAFHTLDVFTTKETPVKNIYERCL